MPARKFDNHELLSENNAASAPKEIMRLINWLMTEATTIVCGRVDAHLLAVHLSGIRICCLFLPETRRP